MCGRPAEAPKVRDESCTVHRFPAARRRVKTGPLAGGAKCEAGIVGSRGDYGESCARISNKESNERSNERVGAGKSDGGPDGRVKEDSSSS